MNLAGLGQILSGASANLPRAEQNWMEVQRQKLALQEYLRNQQTLVQWFQSLQTPDMGALPQQGVPGSPQQQQQTAQATPAQLQTQPAPMGLRPTDAALSGAPQGAASPQPGPQYGIPPTAVQQDQPQGQPTGQPDTSIRTIDPMQELRRMAQEIKRANPTADPLTMAQELKIQLGAIKDIDPLGKQLMQAQIKAAELQAKYYGINAGIQRTGMQQEGAMARTQVQQSGAMSRAQLMAETRQTISNLGGAGVKPSLDEGTAAKLAEAWIKGDRTVVQGLGYGKIGAANRALVLQKVAELADQQGLSGGDLAAARVDLMGDIAASRSAATTGTRIDIGAHELDKFTQPVLDASRSVDRSRFPTWNAFTIAAQRGGFGTPQEQQNATRLVIAVNALKNAYAQIAARGGQSTDDARRRADEVISAAWSQGQIEAGIQQLKIEAQKALEATSEVRTGATRGMRTPSAGGAVPAGNVIQYDAQGNRIQPGQ